MFDETRIRRIVKATGLGVTLLIVSECGLPDPPDMRGQFFKALEPLGIISFYPLLETPRIGQVWIVDRSYKPGDTGASAVFPPSLLVTETLVPKFETFRQERMASTARFPCSSAELASQLSPADQKRAYYQQLNCSPPLPATSPSRMPGTAAIDQPKSLPPLELAGLPSYRLAAITNFSGAAAMPSAFANFFAAVGFRQSNALEVEAEGIEIADLPEDTFASAIRAACNDPASVFHDRRRAQALLTLANQELEKNFEGRTADSYQQAAPYSPAVYMLKRVYYLRGIRYILKDSRAYAALLEASRNAQIPSTSPAPTLPTVSVNVVPPNQTSGAVQDETTAQLSALQSQIDSLRAALGNSTNRQFAGTFARATARGIEFVDLFQRPMAFGYFPFGEELEPEKGFSAFCVDVGVY